MDEAKGAVEQDNPEQPTNLNFQGQLGHRDQDPMLKSSDTDFPEPGPNEEHTGEPKITPEGEISPEGAEQDQDPGHRQKRNQGEEKDDPLAA